MLVDESGSAAGCYSDGQQIEIARHGNAYERHVLSKTEELCDGAVRSLWANSNELIRTNLASRDNLPLDVWEQLATDPKVRIRAAVAEKAPLSRQQQFLDDRSEIVRRHLARNAALCPEIQVALTFKGASVWKALRVNETVSPCERMLASFVSLAYPSAFAEMTKDADPETIRALSANWEGDVASLVEAARLVQR